MMGRTRVVAVVEPLYRLSHYIIVCYIVVLCSSLMASKDSAMPKDLANKYLLSRPIALPIALPTRGE